MWSFDQHQHGDIITIRDVAKNRYLLAGTSLKSHQLQYVQPPVTKNTEFQVHESPSRPGFVFLQAGRASGLYSKSIRPFLFHDGINGNPLTWVQRDPTRTTEQIADLGGFLFRFVPVEEAGSTRYLLTSLASSSSALSVSGTASNDMLVLDSADYQFVKLEVNGIQHVANPSAQAKNPCAVTSEDIPDIPAITSSNVTTATTSAMTLPWWAWFLLFICLILFFALLVIFFVAYSRGYRYVLPSAMPPPPHP